MISNKPIENNLVDQLNDIGLPLMAAKLDELYHSPEFLEIDRLTLLATLIGTEYDSKVSRRVNNRLRHAKLIGNPEALENCTDSMTREYFPYGITGTLSSLDFIHDGMNVCILGASDSGKTYLAKALGIAACACCKVEYCHCGDLLSDLVALRKKDYTKYQKRLKSLISAGVLILDDFLLHTISDEEELRILFTLMEHRVENRRSTIVCSQRDPKTWASMMLNDEVSANAIVKRATKHYTVLINTKPAE